MTDTNSNGGRWGWFRALNISLGGAFVLLLQTIALTAWLVRMNNEVGHLRSDHDEMSQRISQLDEKGSRAIAPLTAQLSDLTATITRLDLVGTRKNVETVANVEAISQKVQVLKEISDARGVFMEQARAALTAQAVMQSEVRNIQDRLRTMMSEIAALQNAVEILRAAQLRDSTATQGRIDVVKADIDQVRDQQVRLMQALDSTYNAMQDHLRGGEGKSTPLKPPPPTKH